MSPQVKDVILACTCYQLPFNYIWYCRNQVIFANKVVSLPLVVGLRLVNTDGAAKGSPSNACWRGYLLVQNCGAILARLFLILAIFRYYSFAPCRDVCCHDYNWNSSSERVAYSLAGVWSRDGDLRFFFSWDCSLEVKI